MNKKILSTGIIFFFILSALTPMCVGYYANTSEESIVMDNLDFYFYNEHGSSKADYYREYLEQDYSKDDVKPDEQTIISVEPLEQIVSGGSMDSAWPMKCHDLHHTSQSPYSTADNPGIEKWRFECDHVDGGIAIDNNGILYFGDTDYHIFAVYSNGIEKWRYRTKGWITSTPTITEDGTIYVGSWDSRLYALNPNGTLKWEVGVGATITSSPAVAEDGTIYLGTMTPGYSIVAVNPNGTIKWSYKTSSWITSDPAIGDDGTIYIGSSDSYLYAMNPDGTLKWRFKTGHYIKGPPSVADDGTIYVGSYDDYLYALYPNSTMKWKIPIGTGTETNPSIASDGTIYVGDDKLYAINPDGTMKWSFYLGQERRIHMSSPAISSDGTIYVGTNIGDVVGGEIIAVNPDGTEKWRKKIAYSWVDSSPSIAEDGTVYIGSTYEIGRGYLHAFGSVESNVPPERPTISGNKNGKIGKEYWFEIGAVDPDNNPISLYIEWGDGTNTGWTREQASGQIWYYEHTWSKWGTYTIRAKAKDVFDAESGCTEFKIKITIPRTRASYASLLLRFFDMFPILQRLLDFIK